MVYYQQASGFQYINAHLAFVEYESDQFDCAAIFDTLSELMVTENPFAELIDLPTLDGLSTICENAVQIADTLHS